VRAWRRCWVRARLLCTREEIDGQNSKTLKRMAPHKIALAAWRCAPLLLLSDYWLALFLGQLSSSLSGSCSCLMPDPNDANSIMRESTGREDGAARFWRNLCAQTQTLSSHPDVTVNKLLEPKFARKVVCECALEIRCCVFANSAASSSGFIRPSQFKKAFGVEITLLINLWELNGGVIAAKEIF
jgi:hypothetical protein